MRILADENIPHYMVVSLRERGHDVFYARTEAPQENDGSLVARAVRDDRVVLTFDADFGELLFNKGLRPFCGVIYLRARKLPPVEILQTVLQMLANDEDWQRSYSVIDFPLGRIRRWALSNV